MAIWQFKIFVIPKSALLDKFGAVPITLSRRLTEEFDWWAARQPPLGFEVGIDVMLCEIKSWSSTMRIWGDERGDVAWVCYDDKHKCEQIEFGIDVRQISLSFIRGICEFATRFECVLVTRAYHIIAPDEFVILGEINNSTAKKYLEDPASTLRNLKGEIQGRDDKPK